MFDVAEEEVELTVRVRKNWRDDVLEAIDLDHGSNDYEHDLLVEMLATVSEAQDRVQT